MSAIHDTLLTRATTPKLPKEYRLVRNEIRQANRKHRLDCGCLIYPGTWYHRVVYIYKGKPRQLVYYKGHIIGCLERIQ